MCTLPGKTPRVIVMLSKGEHDPQNAKDADFHRVSQSVRFVLQERPRDGVKHAAEKLLWEGTHQARGASQQGFWSTARPGKESHVGQKHWAFGPQPCSEVGLGRRKKSRTRFESRGMSWRSRQLDAVSQPRSL